MIEWIIALSMVSGCIAFLVIIGYYYFKGVKKRDKEAIEAVVKKTGALGEKVLGLIRVRRRRPGTFEEVFYEILVLTPNRVLVERIKEWTPTTYGENILYVTKTVDVPKHRIKGVKLSKFLRGVKLSIITDKGGLQREYKWSVQGLIPEKKGVKLEDYEKMLRPIFGEKLSVKK